VLAIQPNNISWRRHRVVVTGCWVAVCVGCTAGWSIVLPCLLGRLTSTSAGLATSLQSGVGGNFLYSYDFCWLTDWQSTDWAVWLSAPTNDKLQSSLLYFVVVKSTHIRYATTIIIIMTMLLSTFQPCSSKIHIHTCRGRQIWPGVER